MIAEHILGLADYLYRKASNIKVGFLDGKVKCTINGSMQWLCAHSLNEQENIVKFCIRQAQRVINNMNTTFLYYKISDLKIRFKRRTVQGGK